MNCLLLLSAFSLLYGCGTGNQGNSPAAQSSTKPSGQSPSAATQSSTKPSAQSPSVVITPKTAQIRVGDTQQFSVTVSGLPAGNVGGPTPGVTWSVNGVPGGNATLGSIDAKGFYTAPAILPNSTSFIVRATSVADTGSSGTAVVVLQQLAVSSSTINYYVNAETGDDSYDGTAPTYTGGDVGPWLTLRRAGLTATAGATVHVADGIYRIDGKIGSATSIETKNSGSPNAWITYVSDNKWGAKIVNTNEINGPDNIAWVVEGDYQIVKDFDISGGPYTGIFVDGNHVQLIGNHLHDISSASCVAGSFIYVNSPYQYVDSIGNVLHDGGMTPWPSDCSLWHGIYYGGVTKGPVQHGQISNNIIYRVSGYGIHFWHKVSHIDVLNNLIFSNVKGGIVIGASDGSTNDYFNVNNNMVIYNSNMIDRGPASLGWGISQYVNGGQIGPHNSYLNNLVYENHAANGWGGSWSNQAERAYPTGMISGTITADPLLVNYQNSPGVPTIVNGRIVFAGADYHPKPNSPAKNACDVKIAPPTDINGILRVAQNKSCDIGPY